MESMSVDTARVTELSNQIRTGGKRIADTLEELERNIGKLRASWSGEAQVAYDQAQRDWHTQVGEMQDLLMRIADKTQEISSGYSHTDAQAAKRFAH